MTVPVGRPSATDASQPPAASAAAALVARTAWSALVARTARSASFARSARPACGAMLIACRGLSATNPLPGGDSTSIPSHNARDSRMAAPKSSSVCTSPRSIPVRLRVIGPASAVSPIELNGIPNSVNRTFASPVTGPLAVDSTP